MSRTDPGGGVLSEPDREPSDHDQARESARLRRGLDPEERRRVLDAVALRAEDGWLFRFGVMLGLSVVVAVMGLSADSAAIVIGAMLLAPLMTPVMGTAAAMAMALPRHLSRSLVIVVVSSLGGIALSFVLATVLPDSPMSSEVLSRTSPDLRDLLVALAAGAAGAYATIRSDVSSSLPGVAVAVALVPPLATVGVTIEAGRGDLVGGAVLLYSANLLAIVLIATLVFVATGFVPRRRLATKGVHVVGGGMIVTAATVAVAVPLAVASIAAADAGRERSELHAAAEGWILASGDELDEVRLVDGDVRISISGPNAPPGMTDLERAVQEVLGNGAAVEVRWTQTRSPQSEADGDPEAASQVVVHGVVDAWLGDTGAYEVEELEVGDDEISVHVTSATPPPSVDDLAARLEDELDVTTPVVVHWTRRTQVRSDDSAAKELDPIAATEAAAARIVRDWARDHGALVVDDVSFDGEVLTVELLGPEAIDVTALETQLRAATGPDAEIEVWLIRRERLAQTVPAG